MHGSGPEALTQGVRLRWKRDLQMGGVTWTEAADVLHPCASQRGDQGEAQPVE